MNVPAGEFAALRDEVSRLADTVHALGVMLAVHGVQAPPAPRRSRTPRPRPPRPRHLRVVRGEP